MEALLSGIASIVLFALTLVALFLLAPLLVIPYSNEQPHAHRFPIVTVGLIVLNTTIFISTRPLVRMAEEENLRIANRETLAQVPEGVAWDELSKEDQEGLVAELNAKLLALHMRTHPSYRFGLIPSKKRPETFITYSFLHTGVMHLFFNLLFLWAVGVNLEESWGRPLTLIMYLAFGAFAGWTDIAFSPGREAPTIGASGAIAGFMGAFMIRFHSIRIKAIWLWLPARLVRGSWRLILPAWIFFCLWFTKELVSALHSSVSGEGGLVALWTHVGGFFAGAVAAILWRMSRLEERFIQPRIERKLGNFVQDPDIVRAWSLLDENRLAAATRLFSRVLEAGSENIEALAGLARAYELRGDAEALEKVVNRLLAVRLRHGDEAGAIETFRRSRTTDPPVRILARSRHSVAEALSRAGAFREAADTYAELIENAPHYPALEGAALHAAQLYLRRLEDLETAQEILVRFESLGRVTRKGAERIRSLRLEMSAARGPAGGRSSKRAS